MRTMIKGGTLIYGGGVKKEDIMIDRGKISEIKSSIRPRGGEKVVDATECFVLPGFISTCPVNGQPDYHHGVTTCIKKIHPTLTEFHAWTVESHPFRTLEGMDYVYQIVLSEANKEILQKLDHYRVKVIELEQTFDQIDWEWWQPRLERIGLVIKLEEQAYHRLPPSMTLPILIPYGKMKRTSRPRTVFQVQADEHRPWQKWSRRIDPYVTSSFWVDGQECAIPHLEKEQEILRYLMMLVKTRASTPAKLFGIYPQKGSLHIGADADVLIVPKKQFSMNTVGVMKPTFVAVHGKWIGEVDKLEGNYVKANRTYAYSY